MTAIDERTNPETAPAAPTGEPEETPSNLPEPPAKSADERRKRRRKAALLVFLTSLVGVLSLFSFWYLVYRKPVTELPLPGIAEDALPHYSFSIYGATNPIGVAVSADGSRVYVAESADEALVRVFDGSGKQLGTMAPPNTTAASRVPTYLAVDPLTGDVYVSDRVAAAVYVFDRDGRYRRAFAPATPVSKWVPLGLAFDSKGDLYVGNVGGTVQEVLEFDRAGNLVATLGSDVNLSFPNGIAVSPSGTVYVADGTNGRLLALGQDGRRVGAVPRGDAAGELGLPRGAATDDTGHLYVADASGQHVQVYRTVGSPQPVFVGSLGSIGRGDGQFAFPNGVAADTRGHVYVADWDNNRVQVWSY